MLQGKVECPGLPLAMAENNKKIEQETKRIEKSILPLKYVDMVEDVFHALLAIVLKVRIF